MHISAAFDSGNIKVVSAESPDAIRVAIQPDPGADGFFQWFHFRITGCADTDLTIVIENAGKASYTKGWDGYRACVSEDRETWIRAETDYDGTVLTIRHKPHSDTLYVAYFAPYSRERHHDLIAACQTVSECRHAVLGETLDGEPIDLLSVGEAGAGKPNLWVIGRQHPGETQASWWMEGFLERLLDPDDPIAKIIRARAVTRIVPNMNPDGSRRGHLRTNAKGINLNREWAAPSLENSPEVYHVLAEMTRTGLDFSLDVHGDEGLPYNFIAGADAIPSVTDKQIALRERFETAFARANPDFQTEHGYPKAAPGKANLTICSSALAEKFGGLSMTLEMPFKDNANAPDPDHGWSPRRCQLLGAAALDAIADILADLR